MHVMQEHAHVYLLKTFEIIQKRQLGMTVAYTEVALYT